jgi:hypothetical protein
MNRWIISIITAAVIIGGGVLVKVMAQSPGKVLIAGDQPVTEEQVRSKLAAEGWTGVQTKKERNSIQVTGTYNGQSQKITVDSSTGRVQAADDDDDDDDDK